MEKDIRISQWMDTHREELVEDLKTLCRIDSTSGPAEEGAPYGPGPKKALEAAMALCAGYGFDVTNRGDRVMTADMGPAEPLLDMLAHLDVVGPGGGSTAGAWRTTRAALSPRCMPCAASGSWAIP